MSTLTTPEQTISVQELQDQAQHIPASPKERLHPEAWQQLRQELVEEGPPNVFIDAHMHTFTFEHVPADFMRHKSLWGSVQKSVMVTLFKKFSKNILSNGQADVLSNLLDIYSQSKAIKDDVSDIYLIDLMMDMERGITGGVDEDFMEQMTELCQIKQNFTYEKNGTKFNAQKHLLPFMAIDPHNPKLYEQFLSAFIPSVNYTNASELNDKAPFVGLKVYPSLGYVPHHPTLMPIYEICEEKQIPIVSHTGGTRTHCSYDKIEAQYTRWNKEDEKWESAKHTVDQSRKNIREHYSQFFLDPENWRLVLKHFPLLRINLAHFGDNDDWLDYRKGRHSKVHRTIRLIEDHQHVYADFSYSFYRKVNIKAIYKAMKEHEFLKEKVLYGSDYYLCEVEEMLQSLKHYVVHIEDIFKKQPYKDNIFFKNAIRFLLS